MKIHVVTLTDDDGQILEVLALGSFDLAERAAREMNVISSDHASVQATNLSVIVTDAVLDEFLAGFREDVGRAADDDIAGERADEAIREMERREQRIRDDRLTDGPPDSPSLQDTTFDHADPSNY